MTTDPWVLVLVSVITASGLVSVSLINLWAAKLANKNAILAADAVRGVEIKLATTYTQTDKKLDEIHTAVNGRLSVAQNTITWLEQQLYAARQAMPVSVQEATRLEHDPRSEIVAPPIRHES